MSKREIEFSAKDAGLREDVNLLGTLVGDVLTEQGGETLFAQVERVRACAIARREGSDPHDLERELAALTAEQATELAHAFSTYFQVVNLAERVHRIRRRRDYERESKAPQPEGLEDSLQKLQTLGCDRQAVQTLVNGLRIEPVFTAHPTEATRRTLLEKQQRLARALIERLDPSLTPREDHALIEQMRNEIASAWQTEEHPEAQKTVANEREHVLFYLTDILYRVLPVFYERLAEALTQTGISIESAALPTIVRFGSWVGGDMDGNPNVTAATMRETLADHRARVLALYRPELQRLYRQLSQSQERIGFDAAVLEQVEAYANQFPETERRLPARHADMPYRRLLAHMQARLAAVETDQSGAYPGPDALLHDLRLIQASLRQHRGKHAGLFAIERLIRRVETFGFHLATLDVRQDALVHRKAIGQLLDDAQWQDRPAAERAKILRTRPKPKAQADDISAPVLEVFQALREAHAAHGAHAVGPYIISMAQNADDVLSVLWLAEQSDLLDANGRVPLDVAPLFETVDDLRNAADVMQGLYQDPAYRAHLAARGDHQMIMVGYSDSNKDGGLAAARWALYQSQTQLAEVCRRARVALTIFHGRGGTVSRGGGRTHRAVLASPPGTVQNRLRVTEQGEMINAKYGLRGIALRTLEQSAGAVLLVTANEAAGIEHPATADAVMEVLASASRKAFKALVYESPDFNDYFRNATPIDVIERMRIGSRPASRRSKAGVQDLRAIPWVFSWTQSRHILTGWYGLGTGLAAAAAAHGEQTLRHLARDWRFFDTLLDDAEMVLAKTDMAIAKRYAALAGPGLMHHYETIRAEYQRTVEWVLRLRDQQELLDGDPTLQRSIRLRNPYVDPMSLLQVDLLARWRAQDRADDALLDALFATINGIAQGLQNTG
ncbi:MAG TPA: phosphoenolpyruvate carboxylase [Gammaproteobacteria bacterium]|nr:phosphoenolpyruvate carboxylase [Gammaproteobacteria bacterium]